MEGTFEGAAGGQIHWRSWEASSPKAQIVIVHGYGEHGGRYARFAERLSDEGFTVWAGDHRGHGKSEGPRGVLTTIEDAISDVDKVVGMGNSAQPDAPLFMFAHSMGGTIGLSYALEHQGKLTGLILSSAAVSLEGIDVPAAQAAVTKVLSKLAPRLPVNRLPLDGISRDPEEERIYMEDPLVHTGAQPARTVAVMLKTMGELPGRVGQLQIPVLVIAGTADPLVPADGSREIFEETGSSDKKLIVYEGFVHELINEPLEDRERVTRDIVDWLESHTG